jgi:hypothetical protein
MDIENIKKQIDDIIENRPSKDVFEKCLMDLITEKTKIIPNEENKKLIEEMDKVMESIQIYLSVASK